MSNSNLLLQTPLITEGQVTFFSVNMFINLFSHHNLLAANAFSEQKEPQADLNEVAYNPGKLYKKGLCYTFVQTTEAFSSGCNMISTLTRACLASLKH